MSIWSQFLNGATLSNLWKCFAFLIVVKHNVNHELVMCIAGLVQGHNKPLICLASLLKL